jgi:hypothetical protein
MSAWVRGPAGLKGDFQTIRSRITPEARTTTDIPALSSYLHGHLHSPSLKILAGDSYLSGHLPEKDRMFADVKPNFVESHWKRCTLSNCRYGVGF